jgi:Flp pilus assembly protein TadD
MQKQAIGFNPNFAPAYFGKGNALNNLGKSGEARQAYKKARQLGYSG